MSGGFISKFSTGKRNIITATTNKNDFHISKSAPACLHVSKPTSCNEKRQGKISKLKSSHQTSVFKQSICKTEKDGISEHDQSKANSFSRIFKNTIKPTPVSVLEQKRKPAISKKCYHSKIAANKAKNTDSRSSFAQEGFQENEVMPGTTNTRNESDCFDLLESIKQSDFSLNDELSSTITSSSCCSHYNNSVEFTGSEFGIQDPVFDITKLSSGMSDIKIDREELSIPVESPETLLTKSNVDRLSQGMDINETFSPENNQELSQLKSYEQIQYLSSANIDSQLQPSRSDAGNYQPNTSTGRRNLIYNRRSLSCKSAINSIPQDTATFHNLRATLSDTTFHGVRDGLLVEPQLRCVPVTVANSNEAVISSIRHTLPITETLQNFMYETADETDTSTAYSLSMSGTSYSSNQQEVDANSSSESEIALVKMSPLPTSVSSPHEHLPVQGDGVGIPESPNKLQSSSESNSDSLVESSEMSEVSPSEFFTEDTLVVLDRIMKHKGSKRRDSLLSRKKAICLVYKTRLRKNALDQVSIKRRPKSKYKK